MLQISTDSHTMSRALVDFRSTRNRKRNNPGLSNRNPQMSLEERKSSYIRCFPKHAKPLTALRPNTLSLSGPGCPECDRHFTAGFSCNAATLSPACRRIGFS
jgi:hypothetical protein